MYIQYIYNTYIYMRVHIQYIGIIRIFSRLCFYSNLKIGSQNKFFWQLVFLSCHTSIQLLTLLYRQNNRRLINNVMCDSHYTFIKRQICTRNFSRYAKSIYKSINTNLHVTCSRQLISRSKQSRGSEM